MYFVLHYPKKSPWKGCELCNWLCAQKSEIWHICHHLPPQVGGRQGWYMLIMVVEKVLFDIMDLWYFYLTVIVTKSEVIRKKTHFFIF